MVVESIVGSSDRPPASRNQLGTGSIPVTSPIWEVRSQEVQCHAQVLRFSPHSHFNSEAFQQGRLAAPLHNRQFPQAYLDAENGKKAYLAAVPQDSLKKMSAVDTLVAIEEIKLIALRYARCITQKDWQCLKNDVFAADFYYLDGRQGCMVGLVSMDDMKSAGCYDRRVVLCRVTVSGQEIELASPTLARGISTADFTFGWMGGNFPVTGKEVVGPEKSLIRRPITTGRTPRWTENGALKTNDHISFDLRRNLRGARENTERAHFVVQTDRSRQRTRSRLQSVMNNGGSSGAWQRGIS